MTTSRITSEDNVQQCACLSIDNSEVVIPTEALFRCKRWTNYLAGNVWQNVQRHTVNTTQLLSCTFGICLQPHFMYCHYTSTLMIIKRVRITHSVSQLRFPCSYTSRGSCTLLTNAPSTNHSPKSSVNSIPCVVISLSLYILYIDFSSSFIE